MTTKRASTRASAGANNAPATANNAPATISFRFGDPDPVLDRSTFISMLQTSYNGRYFEPPVPPDGLAKAFGASPHHASAMLLKRNLLVRGFAPNRLMDRSQFERLALDYLVFGNGYVQRVDNQFGRLMGTRHAPARFLRRMPDQDGVSVYGQIAQTSDQLSNAGGRVRSDLFEFDPGTIGHVLQYDINQELYGVPEYLAALQSALLNESATLFRRKYYLNGSHAGYILHLDGQFVEKDVAKIEQALKDSKGPGNFRNLLLHSTGQTKDAVKLIPISEVAAKDEFLGIKNTTRDDVLSAHRVPPQLLGIIPSNAGGFGNVTDAVEAFYWLEIMPLQTRLLALNDWLGEEVIAFADPGRPISTSVIGGGGKG